MYMYVLYMYIRQLLTIDIDLSLFIFLGRIWDGECLFAQFVVDPYVMVSLGSIFEPMPSAAAFVCGVIWALTRAMRETCRSNTRLMASLLGGHNLHRLQVLNNQRAIQGGSPELDKLVGV